MVHVDGRDVQYIVALDKFSGDTVWKTDRSVDYSTVPENQRKAFTMPTLVPRPGGEDRNARQLVSPAAQAVYAYDPATGEELWKVRHSGWSIDPFTPLPCAKNC